MSEFDDVQLEKVERLFEILESISQVRFLRERLAFYGGTCLNFAYFDGVPRLSVDLDFNYRHQGDRTWQDDRDRIDNQLKDVLYDIGYEYDDINIQAFYPLTRMILQYPRSSGGLDSVEIEVGYQRRIPFLLQDAKIEVENPITGETCSVTAPQQEELFSNKFCTMLYRTDPASPRDVFDIYEISQLDFDPDRFRALAVLDSLTRARPDNHRLHSIPVGEVLTNVDIDDRLRNLLRNRDPPQDLRPRVTEFSGGVIGSLTGHEIGVIDAFYDAGEMRFQQLPASDDLHLRVREHPALLFSLHKLGHIDAA